MCVVSQSCAQLPRDIVYTGPDRLCGVESISSIPHHGHISVYPSIHTDHIHEIQIKSHALSTWWSVYSWIEWYQMTYRCAERYFTGLRSWLLRKRRRSHSVSPGRVHFHLDCFAWAWRRLIFVFKIFSPFQFNKDSIIRNYRETRPIEALNQRLLVLIIAW